MSEKAGLVNEYICEKCRQPTVTINRDEGTTPFTLKCRYLACRQGMAQSLLYRVNQYQRPDWEWIKPTPEEFERYIKDHKEEEYRDILEDHVKNGGMLLLKLDASGRERYRFRNRRG